MIATIRNIAARKGCQSGLVEKKERRDRERVLVFVTITHIQSSCAEVQRGTSGPWCRREWCWNSVTRSPAFREYPVRRQGQSADRWALWRASANHQPCAC